MNIREIARDAERKVLAETREKGKVTPYEFSDGAVISEMIGTSDGAKEFVEKITYDLASGYQSEPLVYKDIYTTLTDANFPETMTVKSFGNVESVFLQKLEGGEIKFGSIGAGKETVVKMETWASGMEYDEDITEYNQTWRVSSIGESIGVAYNRLLNNLYLSPIIDGAYDHAHQVVADTATTSDIAKAIKKQNGNEAIHLKGVAQEIKGGLDKPKTWKAALSILPAGSIILCSSYDEATIKECFLTDILANKEQSPTAKKLSAATFITYDGAIFNVGADSYEYKGCPIGTAFLIVPKQNFKEYIKHDLRVDSGDGDLSRLVVAQIVARARRGVALALGGKNGAVKITSE
jgi:hypothetical protein|nr:MAG TPA: major capsid protein [Caudoviricetes sp.]